MISVKTREWVLFGLAACLFLFYIALHGHAVFARIDHLPWMVLVPVLASFALVHSIYMLGWRRAVAMMGCVTVVAFTFEWYGQSVGTLYGPYCYTPLLGPKVGGRIPVLIPFAWYMMVYPSYVITNLLVEGRATSDPRRPLRWLVLMSVISATVLTAWDLTMDPIMSYEDPAVVVASGAATTMAAEEMPAWRWTTETAEPAACEAATRLPDSERTHFGVPWQNYLGWMLTGLTVFLIFRLIERRLLLHRRELEWRPVAMSRLTALMPVTSYMAMALVDAVLGSPRVQDVHMIAPFAMGLPAALAAIAIFKPGFTLHHPEEEQEDSR